MAPVNASTTNPVTGGCVLDRRSTMGEELAGWDKATTLTVNSPKTLVWAEDHKDSVAGKRALKPEAIVDANTLRTEDGR